MYIFFGFFFFGKNFLYLCMYVVLFLEYEFCIFEYKNKICELYDYNNYFLERWLLLKY